jgi:hypothetical protein
MTETTNQNATPTETKTKKRAAPKNSALAKSTATKTKTAKTAKAAKPEKPKREKAPKKDLMTFAFRMPKTESAALHASAGPANASRTMRALAAAFVAEDRAQFESIVEEARKLRT